MSSWLRVLIAVVAIILVMLQFVLPRQGVPLNPWLRFLPPAAVILAAAVIAAPDSSVAPAMRYGVFIVALAYAWFRWGPPSRRG